MLTSLALGAVTGVVTAAIVIAIAVGVTRYRKKKRLEDIKKKHHNSWANTYHNHRERKAGRVETGLNTIRLCNDMVQVTRQPVQLPITESRLARAQTVCRTESCASHNEDMAFPARHQMRRGSSLINLPSAVTDEDDFTSCSAGATCCQMKSNKPSICRSTNCIFPPSSSAPPRKSKKSKPSHSRAEPEYFQSAAEAIQSTCILKKLSGDSIGNFQPEIILSLVYDKTKAAITLTVLCVTGLNERLSDSSDIYVQALLRPKYHKKQVTRPLSPLDGQFNECFYFGQVWSSDLETSHLLLTVHKTPGNRKLAEQFLMLAQLKIEPWKTLHFKLPLISESRNKKKTTSEKLMEFELGQVLILLSFQNDKLKVVLFKAKKLPKTDSLPFRPDYHVIVELYRRSDYQVVETKVSGIQSGENPTWNEAFCFILQSNEFHDHFIDFTVVERRRLPPSDVVIGHILLGPNGTGNHAINHWNNCVLPWRLEESKWHNVLPAIKY